MASTVTTTTTTAAATSSTAFPVANPSDVLMQNFKEYLAIYDGKPKAANEYQHLFDKVFHPEWVIVLPPGPNSIKEDYIDRESALRVFQENLEVGSRIENLHMRTLDPIRIEFQFGAITAKKEGEGKRVDEIHDIGIATNDGMMYQTQPCGPSVYRDLIKETTTQKERPIVADPTTGVLYYISPTDILIKKMTSFCAFFDGIQKTFDVNHFRKIFDDMFHPDWAFFVGPENEALGREKMFLVYKNFLETGVKVDIVRLQKLDTSRVEYITRMTFNQTRTVAMEYSMAIAGNKSGKVFFTIPLNTEVMEKLGIVWKKQAIITPSSADIAMRNLQNYFAIYDGQKKLFDKHKSIVHATFHPDVVIEHPVEEGKVDFMQRIKNLMESGTKVENVRMNKLDDARFEYSLRYIMEDGTLFMPHSLATANNDGRLIKICPIDVKRYEDIGVFKHTPMFSNA